jgi:spermidine/putrescine-binding protein
LDDFKEASGIDVNMSLFATNDELFAKLRAGNPGYDVIVPGSAPMQSARSFSTVAVRYRAARI